MKRMKDVGKKSFSAAIYGVFDLGDQPKDDVPSDIIERLIAIDPVLAKKIENGKAEIHYDSEMKGEDSSHRFDAVVSSHRNLILVRYYRDMMETDVDNLSQLHDDVLDVCAGSKVRMVKLIAIGKQFTPEGMDFMEDDENWHFGKCEISCSLVQLSKGSYNVLHARNGYSNTEEWQPHTMSMGTDLEAFTSIRKIGKRIQDRKAVIAVIVALIVVVAGIAYIASLNKGGGTSVTGGFYASKGSTATAITWTIMSTNGEPILKSDVYVQMKNSSGALTIDGVPLQTASGTHGFFYSQASLGKYLSVGDVFGITKGYYFGVCTLSLVTAGGADTYWSAVYDGGSPPLPPAPKISTVSGNTSSAWTFAVASIEGNAQIAKSDVYVYVNITYNSTSYWVTIGNTHSPSPTYPNLLYANGTMGFNYTAASQGLYLSVGDVFSLEKSIYSSNTTLTLIPPTEKYEGCYAQLEITF